MATHTATDILDEICPGIIDNPYLGGHFPHPRQFEFLRQSLEGSLSNEPTEVYEALFGGAAGGGKSDAVLMAAGQMAWLYPGSSSCIIRRTMMELTKPGALLNRALKWWLPAGVKWHGTDHLFEFPNGSQVQVGYHHHTTHDAQYQGGEYQLVVFDELTHWPTDDAWMHLRSRMRRPEASGWPLRLLGTSNPGGPGMAWVKARFVGGTDLATGERLDPPHHFFPSRIDDNPSIDQESYWTNLSHLHPTRMAQLRDGDWDARDPGDFFRIEWFGPLLDPETDRWPASDCIRVRSWDLAASEAANASETAGVLMARHRRGCRAIEHCTAFRLTPGARDGRIVQVAKADGPTVVQHLEVEPGSGGIAQVLNLEAKLREIGCRVVYARPKAELTEREGKVMAANPEHARGKVGRAIPVSSCLYRGHVRRGECEDTGDPWYGADIGCGPTGERDGIRLFAGPWTQAYLDDLEGFPLTVDGNSQRIVRADKVDATVGAWKWLEAHPAGLAVPATRPKAHPPAEQQNLHPSLRTPPDTGRTKGGHWRP